jgi:hypothetical protein
MQFSSTMRAVGLVLAVSCSVHPQAKLVPANLISDDIAYTAMSFVIRDAAPPHWDRPTVLKWLEQRGFVGEEALLLVRSATTFYEKHQEVESRLAAFNQQHRNALTPDTTPGRQALENERKEVTKAAIADLQGILPASSRQRLGALLSEIKSNIRMKAN